MTYPFPLPAGVTNTNVAYFYANNTNRLGVYIKQVSDLSLISVDYSQLTAPVTLASISSFVLDAGGNPPLVVSNPAIDAPTSKVLTFLLSNGLAGVQYTLSIVVNLASALTRTDILTVNMPSVGNEPVLFPANTPIIPWPNQGVVSPDGSVYYNQVPRWFLSSTPPLAPNIMDQWYNPDTALYSQYVTDGVTPRWVINATLSGFDADLAAFWASLPTTLPPVAGVIWNNGGVISTT